MSPRNDIAIYSPFAFAFYEDPSSEAYQDAKGGGGAELQTTLLARILAGDGLRVAHIVYPVAVIAPQRPPSLEVVQRPPRARRRDVLGKLGETLGVWRALVAADARLYVFRTGLSGGVAAFVVGALFCFIRRRRLVLAASNDLDFIFERPDRSRLTEALYRLALTRTRRVVVQSEQQLGLARTAVGNSGRVRLIPSFAEPAEDEATPPKRDAFLWVGRLVEYKLPLRYVELAGALPDVRFVMIAPTTGETTQALKQQLAAETTDLPNLEILAHLRRERTLELIRRSIAVVGTSHHEGMPNVFLEAWSRGVPVISLHFDPDGRIAREGMGICAQGSWDRFVEAARRLREDPELRATLGDSGRRYVARVHSPAIVGAHWITLLRGELGD
jgi:glycosyltransferase involved in cell wall biosynthesis